MQGETRRPRRAGPTTWAALALGCLGAALRLYGFDDHPLWIDEYGTAWVVEASNLQGVWQRAMAIHGQSPLYYLLVDGFVALLGESSLALRLPSLVAGLGLLWAGYWAAQIIFEDARVALATLTVLALDERLVFYAQNARPYALALLFAVLSFGLYARLLRDPRWPVRCAWLVVSAATYYLHFLFVLGLFAQFLHWLLGVSKRVGTRRDETLCFAGLALLMAPGAVQLADLYSRRHVLDWVPVSQESWAGLHFALSLVDVRLLAVVALAALAAWLFERPRVLRLSRSGLAICALWLGVPLVGVMLASSVLGINLLYARYVAVTIPAIASLYGALLCLPRSPRLAGGLLALFVVASLPFGVLPMLEGRGVFDDWYRSQHWERAAGQLTETAQPGELVLYATRFVESDAVSGGEAASHVEEFVSWPLRAHLSEALELRLHALPFRYTAQTLPHVAREIRAAPGRIWVIGLGDGIAPLIPFAEQRLGWAVQSHEQHGAVHLLGLARVDP